MSDGIADKSEVKLELSEKQVNRVESIVNHAIEIRKTVNTDLIPMAHFWDTNGNLTLMATPFEDYQGKQYAAQVVKEKCKDPKVDLLVYVLESWSLKLTPEELEKYKAMTDKERGSISEHPKAVEIISFIVETRSKSYSGISEIIRDGKKIKDITPAKWSKSLGEGTFSNFLNENARLN